jgi:hypothetical protein
MAGIGYIDPWSSDLVMLSVFKKKKKISELMPARLYGVPTIPKIDPVLSLIMTKSRGTNPICCAAHVAGPRPNPFDPTAKGTGRPYHIQRKASGLALTVLDKVLSEFVPWRHEIWFGQSPEKRPYHIQRISFVAGPGLLDNEIHYDNEQILALAARTLIWAK